jgi:hypothetical protein
MVGKRILCAVLLGTAWAAVPTASAQLADTLVTWQTYRGEGITRVRTFAANDEDRPVTIVVDELAENRTGAVTDDVRYFVDHLGRAFRIDPTAATFVFRFTGGSFCDDGGGGDKLLLLRATFRYTAAGNLASPSWRVISRDELADLTDRMLY